MQTNNVQKIVIAGGGTSGWLTAAGLAKLLGKKQKLDITLVESEEIGRIGVGEATIPQIRIFNKLLGIDEQEFMRATQSTFKLGIEFSNWGQNGDKYIHSFGTVGKECWACDFQHFWLAGLEQGISDDFGTYCLELQAANAGKILGSDKSGVNYAYHLDAGLYAEFLKVIGISFGVTRVEGKIKTVHTDHPSGEIDCLELEDGQRLKGDLYIDCTGFNALLSEQTLQTGYEDFGHMLPCNTAVALQTETVGEPRPFTQAIAHEAGWQWRIPLQHRVGNGLVYSDRYISDDEAISTLMNNLESPAITEPKVFKYRTGRRLKAWNKNCIAIGLSSGFVEPVESTAIHLAMSALLRLMRLFPKGSIQQAQIDEYNNQTKEEMERIRDFIILHYFATQRDDTPFWRHCHNLDIPSTLAQKINLFKQTGNVTLIGSELFRVDSWTQVMLGQNIMPESYHPIVDLMDKEELGEFLRKIKHSVSDNLEKMPSHQDFINQYCKSAPLKV